MLSPPQAPSLPEACPGALQWVFSGPPPGPPHCQAVSTARPWAGQAPASAVWPEVQWDARGQRAIDYKLSIMHLFPAARRPLAGPAAQGAALEKGWVCPREFQSAGQEAPLPPEVRGCLLGSVTSESLPEGLLEPFPWPRPPRHTEADVSPFEANGPILVPGC